jgi:CTP synthase (UTP-ammonia lyase)
MIHERARVAVVGDFDSANRTHRFTCDALEHVHLAAEWVPTDTPGDWADRLSRFDGLWIAPASPYRSMDGALAAVSAARERGIPLVGT